MLAVECRPCPRRDPIALCVESTASARNVRYACTLKRQHVDHGSPLFQVPGIG